METVNYYYYLVASSIILISWACWYVLSWVWLRPKKLERELRSQGFAGNSYKSLSGDMKDFSEMIKQASLTPIGFSDDIVPRVMPFLHKSVMTHGEKVFIWFGRKAVVNIMEPELVKEILTNNYKFRKPNPNPIVALLATGIATYEDEKWAKHRKIINPAFHMGKLKNMLSAFHLSCSEMINKWEKIVPYEGSSELNVWPYLQTMTSDVISRTAFGSNYEEGEKIFQLQKEQVGLLMKSLWFLFIPGWRFMPTSTNNRMKEIDRVVKSSLRAIINRRIEAMKSGQAKMNDDLLGILLESNMREIESGGNNKKLGMTINDVIEECRLFYFAGQETTSVLLVWTMILLSKHQDWQQRAREEVLEIFGDKEPDFDSLTHLKTVTMIFYEVLRLYPPLVQFSRAVRENTKLGNIYVPAGAELSLPALLIHHDQRIWGDDAKEFKPERFSEGISKATQNQVSYFPFGYGPRICVGQNFAMLEAKMAMAMILKHFAFELSPSYAHAPFNVITLQPQHGAHLILHSLQKSAGVSI